MGNYPALSKNSKHSWVYLIGARLVIVYFAISFLHLDQLYWPALYTEDYQALTLLFIISNPDRANLLSFDEALHTTAPDIVLVDSIFTTWLNGEQPDGTPYSSPFWQYMTEKNATLLNTLTDPQGNLVEIYQLTQTP